jgi:spore maturation protein CgeB
MDERISQEGQDYIQLEKRGNQARCNWKEVPMNDPLKKHRKRFRIWKNNRRLERELNHYCSIFKSNGMTIPDTAFIRQTIKSKFPNLKLKSKGDLQILAIYHHYNWENESLKPSLDKFGTVRHYDWGDDFNHQERAWHRSIKSKMNDELIRRVKLWIKEDSTDVIFTYLSGEIVTPETVREIANIGIPMVNLCLNDKEAFVGKVKNGLAMGARDISRYFGLCWTSTEDALKKYCVEGALPIYLPEGANLDIHKPYDLKKAIDVSFVGQRYGNRPEVIRKLNDCGIRVEAYGYGWPNGSLSTEEMVKMYSRSKINLGFGGVAGYKDRYCLKGRDFEIPMSGGLYLTEYHSELAGFYNFGTEIMVYKDFNDLLSKIRYLLLNPKEADEIRKKGMLRARREHTWEKRFEAIFKCFGII